MARRCQITGKHTVSGQNRPFSLKATKRKFRPNLFRKKVFNPLTGKVERMRLSARAIRTLKKWAHETEGPTPEVTVDNTPKTTNEEKGRVKKVKLTPKQKKELKAEEEAKKAEEAKPEVVKEMEGVDIKEEKEEKTEKEKKGKEEK